MKTGQSVAPSANMRNVDKGEAGRRGREDKREEHREAWVAVSFEATHARSGDTC